MHMETAWEDRTRRCEETAELLREGKAGWKMKEAVLG